MDDSRMTATTFIHRDRMLAWAIECLKAVGVTPADAKTVSLTCGYGGLREEVITLAPVQALGSLYLLRASEPAAAGQRTK